MTKAIVKQSDASKEWYFVTFPYKADFIAALKAEIPYPHRKWDAETKLWQIQNIYLDALLVILNRYFDEVDFTEAKARRTKTVYKEVAPENMFVAVFDALRNSDDATRVYRALANAMHPDHGGNAELMVKLNLAYESCTKGGTDNE